MGRKDKSQRSAFQPSSSAQAAELLARSASGFRGFDAASTSQFSSVDSEIAAQLKKLSKKDAITKTKALSTLQELFDSKTAEDCTLALLPYLQAYQRLCWDPTARVRAGSHTVLQSITKKVGKELAPHLKSFFRDWYCAWFDPSGEVSKAARGCFEATFSVKKQPEVFAFCASSLVSELKELLWTKAATVKRLDPLTYNGAERVDIEDCIERKISQALQALITVPVILDKNLLHTINFEGEMRSLFADPRFFQIPRQKNCGIRVRTAYFRLLQEIFGKFPDIVATIHPDVLRVLALGFGDPSPSVLEMVFASFCTYAQGPGHHCLKAASSMKELSCEENDIVELRFSLLCAIESCLKAACFAASEALLNSIPDVLHVLSGGILWAPLEVSGPNKITSDMEAENNICGVRLLGALGHGILTSPLSRPAQASGYFLSLSKFLSCKPTSVDPRSLDCIVSCVWEFVRQAMLGAKPGKDVAFARAAGKSFLVGCKESHADVVWDAVCGRLIDPFTEQMKASSSSDGEDPRRVHAFCLNALQECSEGEDCAVGPMCLSVTEACVQAGANDLGKTLTFDERDTLWNCASDLLREIKRIRTMPVGRIRTVVLNSVVNRLSGAVVVETPDKTRVLEGGLAVLSWYSNIGEEEQAHSLSAVKTLVRDLANKGVALLPVHVMIAFLHASGPIQWCSFEKWTTEATRIIQSAAAEDTVGSQELYAPASVELAFLCGLTASADDLGAPSMVQLLPLCQSHLEKLSSFCRGTSDATGQVLNMAMFAGCLIHILLARLLRQPMLSNVHTLLMSDSEFDPPVREPGCSLDIPVAESEELASAVGGAAAALLWAVPLTVLRTKGVCVRALRQCCQNVWSRTCVPLCQQWQGVAEATKQHLLKVLGSMADVLSQREAPIAVSIRRGRAAAVMVTLADLVPAASASLYVREVLRGIATGETTYTFTESHLACFAELCEKKGVDAITQIAVRDTSEGDFVVGRSFVLAISGALTCSVAPCSTRRTFVKWIRSWTHNIAAHPPSTLRLSYVCTVFRFLFSQAVAPTACVCGRMARAMKKPFAALLHDLALSLFSEGHWTASDAKHLLEKCLLSEDLCLTEPAYHLAVRALSAAVSRGLTLAQTSAPHEATAWLEIPSLCSMVHTFCDAVDEAAGSGSAPSEEQAKSMLSAMELLSDEIGVPPWLALSEDERQQLVHVLRCSRVLVGNEGTRSASNTAVVTVCGIARVCAGSTAHLLGRPDWVLVFGLMRRCLQQSWEDTLKECRAVKPEDVGVSSMLSAGLQLFAVLLDLQDDRNRCAVLHKESLQLWVETRDICFSLLLQALSTLPQSLIPSSCAELTSEINILSQLIPRVPSSMLVGIDWYLPTFTNVGQTLLVPHLGLQLSVYDALLTVILELSSVRTGAPADDDDDDDDDDRVSSTGSLSAAVPVPAALRGRGVDLLFSSLDILADNSGPESGGGDRGDPNESPRSSESGRVRGTAGVCRSLEDMWRSVDPDPRGSDRIPANAFGAMLVWSLLLRWCDRVPSRLRGQLAEYLRARGIVPHVLTLLCNTLHLEAAASLPPRNSTSADLELDLMPVCPRSLLAHVCYTPGPCATRDTWSPSWPTIAGGKSTVHDPTGFTANSDSEDDVPGPEVDSSTHVDAVLGSPEDLPASGVVRAPESVAVEHPCLYTESLDPLAVSLFRMSLLYFPALSREWYTQLKRGSSALVESFTTKAVTPAVLYKEFSAVRLAKDDLPSLEVRTMLSSREVGAVYVEDETTIEIVIRLSAAHPLLAAEVETTRRTGIPESRWRKMLLQMTVGLSRGDGRIVDALKSWKSSMDRMFEGVEPCPVCYCVLHVTTLQLPKMPCRTCRYKYHSACLYKWFQTSRNSTCPTCKQPWHLAG
eukprot:Rmarinus@m.24436